MIRSTFCTSDFPHKHLAVVDEWEGIQFLVLPPQQNNSMLDYLSPEESSLYKLLPDGQVQQDWLAGRISAKLLAVRRFGGSHNSYRIINAPNGCPQLFDGQKASGITLSLAHENGWGMAAIASYPLGIDLELIRSSNCKIRHLIGNEFEFSQLESITEGDLKSGATETTLFSLKEAVVKCAKQKLRLPRSQVLLMEASSTKGKDGFFIFKSQMPLTDQFFRGMGFHRWGMAICIARIIENLR